MLLLNNISLWTLKGGQSGKYKEKQMNQIPSSACRSLKRWKDRTFCFKNPIYSMIVFLHWFSVWGPLVWVHSTLRTLQPACHCSTFTLTPLWLSWHLGIVIDQRCHVLFVLVFKVCIFIPFYCFCMHPFRTNQFYLMIYWEQGLGDFFPSSF